jgi:hypothetical protein
MRVYSSIFYYDNKRPCFEKEEKIIVTEIPIKEWSILPENDSLIHLSPVNCKNFRLFKNDNDGKTSKEDQLR